MKKNFLVFFLFLLFPTLTSLAQQSMTSLKDYISNNDVNNVAVQSYIFNRCAAVNLYVGSLTQNSTDKSVMEKSLKNYEFFAETNIKHLVSKGNMTAESARKNFTDNVPAMSKIYGKDGQENFVKTGDYTKGYIFDDFSICNQFLK